MPSIGELTDMKVNLHQLEDHTRKRLQQFVKQLFIEYITLANQNLQIGPIIVHLRLIARLSPRNNPEYMAIVNLINQLKLGVEMADLTAHMMVTMLRPHYIGNMPLNNLVDSFFQMLIENQLLEYNIGPPSSPIDHQKLPAENGLWLNQGQLCRAQKLHMDNARWSNVPKFPNNRATITWLAGKTVKSIQ